jgi:hypothetical protein
MSKGGTLVRDGAFVTVWLSRQTNQGPKLHQGLIPITDSPTGQPPFRDAPKSMACRRCADVTLLADQASQDSFRIGLQDGQSLFKGLRQKGADQVTSEAGQFPANLWVLRELAIKTTDDFPGRLV